MPYVKCGGKMAEIVSIDKAGRIVIPKSIRDSLGIEDGTRFILDEGEHGSLFLKMFNIDEISNRIENETKCKDIDTIVKRIRKEMNDKIKKRYKKVLA